MTTRQKIDPWNSTNPWTREALMNDYHFGDKREALLIALENGQDAPIVCGECGGEAHYKNTIGTEKCTGCGAIRISYVLDADGKFVSDGHGGWKGNWS